MIADRSLFSLSLSHSQVPLIKLEDPITNFQIDIRSASFNPKQHQTKREETHRKRLTQSTFDDDGDGGGDDDDRTNKVSTLRMVPGTQRSSESI